jgi:muramoyltetrapeptide carboxypeptidase
VAEGVLVGGCLSLVVASLGTRYEIDTRGAILFLEDLGEPPYRLDRMLTQLRQAGKLDPIAGLVLGSFSAAPTSESPAAIFDTLREVLGWMEVPVLANFPSGHGPANWALPLNLPARLDATARALEILEPLTRPAHS